MIILKQLGSLEVVLGGAVTTNQLQYNVSYIERNKSCCGTINETLCNTPSENSGNTNNTTAATMVAAPTVPTTATDEIIREITEINVYNADTVNATVTIQVNNNGTTKTLFKAVLATGDNLTYSADVASI